MHAVEKYRNNLGFFEFVHLQNKYYERLASVVVIGNTVLSVLVWYRWCAAFSSGSDVMYAVTKCKLQQLDGGGGALGVLEMVHNSECDGWINAFCWAIGDVHRMRDATDALLIAQRCCITNAEQSLSSGISAFWFCKC